ncbi:MAG: nucleotidyltransferase family protein [Candidatus Micrarchaeia archaeon]
MQALVLCGGFAKRLEPIGEFVPKALLTLNGIPLIEYILNDLEKQKEISSIIVSTNKKFENQFRYWLKLRQRAGLSKNVRLVVEPSTSNENKFGAVKGIFFDITKARVNDDLLIIAGDNFFTFNLPSLISRMSKLGNPSIIAYDIRSKDKAKRFGVIEAGPGGIIKEFEEKPDRPKSSLISTGIYFIHKPYLSKFKEYLEQTNNGDDLGNFIKWLKDQVPVHAIIPGSGEWFDIGTIDGYREIFSKQEKIAKKKSK